MVKAKCRWRSKVWWLKVAAGAEKLCNSSHGCQAVNEYSAPEPMAQANPPSGPWQNCAANMLGPLPSGENLLVKVDYYSGALACAARSGAPWVKECGKLPIRENLVIT